MYIIYIIYVLCTVMYTCKYVNTVDDLSIDYRNVSNQKRNIISPKEYLRLTKSQQVLNEIESSALSDHHTKYANETTQAKEVNCSLK